MDGSAPADNVMAHADGGDEIILDAPDAPLQADDAPGASVTPLKAEGMQMRHLRERGLTCQASPGVAERAEKAPGALSTRHRPRHAAGSYASRVLPEELASSEEATEVWEAAKRAGPSHQATQVHGWRVEWRSRPGAGANKRGDLYVWQPCESAADGAQSASPFSSRPIRSLSALQDVLALRHAAKQAGRDMWRPPLRGTYVEVRLRAEKAAGSAAAGDEMEEEEEEECWRRAEVRRVDTGLAGSFQVVILSAEGLPEEASLQWCTAFDEASHWRRIEGQPIFYERRAAVRPGSAKLGKRSRRCGECDGCLTPACGECSACLDRPKFGGPGRLKQACKRRHCSHPLPSEAFAAMLSSQAAAEGGERGGEEEEGDEGEEEGGRHEEGGKHEEAYEEGEFDGPLGAAVCEAEAEAADLRQQIAHLYRLAASYRETAEEIAGQARYVFPLAHAAVSLAGGSLEAPDCFIRALPELPPWPLPPP